MGLGKGKRGIRFFAAERRAILVVEMEKFEGSRTIEGTVCSLVVETRAHTLVEIYLQERDCRMSTIDVITRCLARSAAGLSVKIKLCFEQRTLQNDGLSALSLVSDVEK